MICQEVFACLSKTDKTRKNHFDLTNVSCFDEAIGVAFFDPTTKEIVNYAWKYSVIYACEGSESSQLDTGQNDQLLNFYWLSKKVAEIPEM